MTFKIEWDEKERRLKIDIDYNKLGFNVSELASLLGTIEHVRFGICLNMDALLNKEVKK